MSINAQEMLERMEAEELTSSNAHHATDKIAKAKLRAYKKEQKAHEKALADKTVEAWEQGMSYGKYVAQQQMQKEAEVQQAEREARRKAWEEQDKAAAKKQKKEPRCRHCNRLLPGTTARFCAFCGKAVKSR